MKQLVLSLISLFVLAGNLHGFQAAGAPQTPVTAPPGTSAEQQKADESQCIKWAKQQAGLSQPESAQQPSGQPSAAGGEKAGAAPADKGGAAKPADNSSPSSASALSGAASQLSGSLGGAMNSKVANLVKQAYAQCMEKKGYKTK